jgi:rubrerythrin
MDIFEYAMQMEKDGEKFYRELAAKATSKGLTSILEMLADEEVKHYQTVSQMQAGSATMAESKILDDVRNVFSEMEAPAEEFDLSGGQIEMYRKAQDIEEQSRKFYADKADETGDDQFVELFTRLAEEEKRHYVLLGNIIEFVSRPSQWLEDAEWSHLEAY